MSEPSTTRVERQSKGRSGSSSKSRLLSLFFSESVGRDRPELLCYIRLSVKMFPAIVECRGVKLIE